VCSFMRAWVGGWVGGLVGGGVLFVGDRGCLRNMLIGDRYGWVGEWVFVGSWVGVRGWVGVVVGACVSYQFGEVYRFSNVWESSCGVDGWVGVCS